MHVHTFFFYILLLKKAKYIIYSLVWVMMNEQNKIIGKKQEDIYMLIEKRERKRQF